MIATWFGRVRRGEGGRMLSSTVDDTRREGVIVALVIGEVIVVVVGV